MSKKYERIAIIGVGLLGGSLGLALKARGLCDSIVGIGRRQSTLDKALEVGAIDEASTSLDAIGTADLIAVCTPAATVNSYLDGLLESGHHQCVVTDVTSTKNEVCSHARDTWPQPRTFIGSHPMAGSESSGPENAIATLYEGAVTFVEEDDHLDATARAAVVELWQSVGSKVVNVNPETHDRLIAHTSHLPHIVASALAQLVPHDDAIRHFIGNGFRDSTRIAEGHPEMWRDICLTNASSIQASVNEMRALLEEFSRSLETGDAAALSRFFENGCDARTKLVDP